MNKILNSNLYSLKYIYIFLDIWKNLKKVRRFQIFLLTIFIFLTGLAEVISLAAVIPFLSVLTNPYDFSGIKVFSPLIKYFGIKESSD